MSPSARTYAWGYAAGVAAALAALTALLATDDPLAASAMLPADKQAEALLRTCDSMIALITTLNTAMFAAAAAVAVKGNQWSRVWSWFDAAAVILVFLCGAISYYGVYVAYVSMLEMIESNGFTVIGGRLDLGFALQYYGTLAGVALLGLVFSRLMAGRRVNDPPADDQEKPAPATRKRSRKPAP